MLCPLLYNFFLKVVKTLLMKRFHYQGFSVSLREYFLTFSCKSYHIIEHSHVRCQKGKLALYDMICVAFGSHWHYFKWTGLQLSQGRRATVDMQCAGRMGSGGDLFQMYLAGIKASTGQRDLTRQEVCNTMDHEVDNLKCLNRETNPGPCAEMRLNEKSVCNTQDPWKTTSNVSSGNLNPGSGTTV